MSLTSLRTFFILRTFILYTFLFLVAFMKLTDGYSQKFEEEIKEAVKSKSKFELKLDSRNSFINRANIRMFGIKVGLQFDNTLSFGLGYNFLLTDFKVNNSVWEGNSYNGFLKYRYVSPYLEYIFYRDNRWTFSIPVQLGFGNSMYQLNVNKEKRLVKKKFVVSYEPAMVFEYRLVKYLGLGAGIGYRLMLKQNRLLEEKFSSPVYLFKAKIYFNEIIQQFSND